jgi:hypothetical protein
MTQPADTKSLTCDAGGIRWERTGFSASTLQSAPGSVRRSAIFFNRGQMSWPLVARNKPVAAGAYWASASPSEAALSPSSTPLRQGFCASAKNQYGAPVVTIDYQFLVQAGGNPGASGQYITRLEIAPTRVNLAWGWNADMTVTIRDPGECGEPASMLAVLQAQVELNIYTEIKKVQETKLHVVFPQGIILA